MRPVRMVVFRAVVGQAADHRVARTAVGAVDVGIAIPPIARVEQLREAFLAHRQIGRDARRWAARARGSPGW